MPITSRCYDCCQSSARPSVFDTNGTLILACLQFKEHLEIMIQGQYATKYSLVSVSDSDSKRTSLGFFMLLSPGIDDPYIFKNLDRRIYAVYMLRKQRKMEKDAAKFTFLSVEKTSQVYVQRAALKAVDFENVIFYRSSSMIFDRFCVSKWLRLLSGTADLGDPYKDKAPKRLEVKVASGIPVFLEFITRHACLCYYSKDKTVSLICGIL